MVLQELIQTFNGIVLGSYMENTFVLEVSDREQLLQVSFGIVDPDHFDVITSNGVVDRQVAVVVAHVRLRLDLVHDRRLTLLADDMLDGVALVVLLATCLEEVGTTLERVKDVYVSRPCTNKQHVLAEIVLQHDSLVSESLEHFDDFHVLALCCQEKGRSAFEVGPETNLWLPLVQGLNSLQVL